jgi:DNA polymerase I
LSEAASAPRHVFLIDASGYIFRAYHALPPLSRADGTPTSAVLGFVNMVLKLLESTDADHVGAVFDSARTSFRNEIYDGYKANRTAPPDDLVPQFALIREACEALAIPKVEAPTFEADDLIATYAREAAEAGAKVTIVSSDKDMMQLVQDDRVVMWDPIKERPIGPGEVAEKFGVPPDKVIDVQALCGDSVDNVPGVPGIGVKTAAELIKQYGTLENLLEHAPEIKQPARRQRLVDNRENALMSKRLVTLDRHVALPCPLADLALKSYDREKLISFLHQNDFRKVIQRLEQGRYARTGSGNGAAAPAPAQIALALPTADDFKQRSYTCVDELPALAKLLAEAKVKGHLALEVLTTSPQGALLEAVGIGFAIEPGRAAYLPLTHANAPDMLEAPPKNVPLWDAMKLLKPVMEDPAVLKVGHNAKYAAHVLGGYGIELAPYDCTELMSFVLDGAQHSHALDDLAARHLRHEMVKYKDLCGSGKAQIGFKYVLVERAAPYGAECADVALRLHRLLKARLPRERMTAFYETIERPMPAVVSRMERAGVRVDRAELRRLSEDFTGRIAALERQIFELAGMEFSIGSPKQLGEVLFEKLQLPGGKKGKTGAYGTDVSILETLAEHGHEVPRKVIEWRQLSKLKSTYADALVEQINGETGRVHTCFQLAVAATGRLSSTEPNVQNIPIRTEEGRKIRRAFVAEQGHVLLSADYSQIELRLAAHVAEVEALKEAFRRGDDIHAATASQVFGVPIEGMDRETRRRAKAINFGIIYGISPFGLAANLGVSTGEASDYIKAYFSRFPGIRDYMDRTKGECRERGYVETLFGRKCYIPNIRAANMAQRQFAERQSINAPLQGTAADIIKRAMARVPPALEKAGLGARMLLQVHDELLFEVREDEAERTGALVKEVMEGACAPVVTLSVPLVVEARWAKNWDEAH